MISLFAPHVYQITPPEKISKRTTSQANRDYERVKVRVQNAGSKLERVTSYLETLFGPHLTAYSLLKHANVLSEKLSINLDRLATRNRQALFCWFAENWEIIRHYLPNVNDVHIVSHKQTNFEKRQPEQIDVTDLSNLLNYH
ncbi:hypothetical protein TVAGG3_0768050 [Trichomonas vaginalis G3]|uniref:hypothetical protein n=1 Tax=Trichomonas vaginalis (strain ATCC PRA-98 / G3) TaxID=412133 RepID=UPI0021E52AC6|nr:hypothetical protein TVAGG3_0768050 [Trichomonas vaginalis G3]KAI5513637.1 hypothetical protein TVAGG3_0768050 [Trichomonas vaginalis G3]